MEAIEKFLAQCRAETKVSFVTRFAPAPTGFLHLGHLASCIYVWAIGRALGAKIFLRIEDHDRGRSKAEYEAAIYDDLQWFGFGPDAAPVLGTASPLRQSDSSDRYMAALATLKRQGLVYACSCSRRDLVIDGDGERRYPGYCRDKNLALDVPGHTLRFRVAAKSMVRFTDGLHGPVSEDVSATCGDFPLRDKVGNWTYQFCVVVDDLFFGTNLVIRGEDLLASTARQLLLAEALSGSIPAWRFWHHPLLLDEQGQKLGKRYFSAALGSLRAAGKEPREIIGGLCAQLGFIEHYRPLGAGDVQLLVDSCHRGS